MLSEWMILRNDSMPINFFIILHPVQQKVHKQFEHASPTHESENQICCMLILNIEIDVLNQCKDPENKVQTYLYTILSCGMSCLSTGQTLCWFVWGPAACLWESEGHHCKGATLLEWGDCASNQGGKESVDCCSWEQFERHCEALRR